MVKKLVKIVSVLLLFALLIAGVFFYSIYYSVDHVKLVNETISSTKIPTSMNDIKIAFISDIKYHGFMKKERLSTMMEALETAGADIVIFGGDVFTSFEEQKPDSQTVREITSLLQNIKAPLGKFAVLGDEDLVSKEAKQKVTTILYNSDFEIITNKKLQIRNGSKDSITLIGLDSMINGNPNVSKPFDNISSDEFNIMVTHCPDIINNNEINTKYLDIILSGHSLGGQIYLPLIGALQKSEGADTYSHGKYSINETKLYVSNGLGTVNMDMRLFARPQILIFRLVHEN